MVCCCVNWKVCLYVFALFSVISVAHPEPGSSPACFDQQTCLAVHLSNAALSWMLNARCNFEGTASSTRRITFTHIPKAGGESIRDFLAKIANERTKQVSHENVYTSLHDEPDNILITRLREPVSKAISFYKYVNGRKSLTPTLKHNKLWADTFRKPTLEWATDPFIQRTLYQDPLGLFLRDVENITDSIAYFDVGKMRAFPDIKFKEVVPGTLDSFLSYTDTLPAFYQCKQHLEVAFILLKQYEVVGILEKSADFFHVLSRRAVLPRHAENGSAIHDNGSTFNLSEAARAVMAAHLEAPLYCGKVLWHIAGMISDADAKCVR
jgi:hypothetical protein